MYAAFVTERKKKNFPLVFFFFFYCRHMLYIFMFSVMEFSVSKYANRLVVLLLFSKTCHQDFRRRSLCLSVASCTLASITISSRHTPSAARHSGAGAGLRGRLQWVVCCLQVLLVRAAMCSLIFIFMFCFVLASF